MPAGNQGNQGKSKQSNRPAGQQQSALVPSQQVGADQGSQEVISALDSDLSKFRTMAGNVATNAAGMIGSLEQYKSVVVAAQQRANVEISKARHEAEVARFALRAMQHQRDAAQQALQTYQQQAEASKRQLEQDNKALSEQVTQKDATIANQQDEITRLMLEQQVSMLPPDDELDFDFTDGDLSLGFGQGSNSSSSLLSSPHWSGDLPTSSTTASQGDAGATAADAQPLKVARLERNQPAVSQWLQSGGLFQQLAVSPGTGSNGQTTLLDEARLQKHLDAENKGATTSASTP